MLRAPQHKSGDAADSDMPKRSPKELPLREKVKVLNLNEERKKLYTEVAKICGKNESSICETMKEGREIHASLAVTPQTAKVKVEKALHLRVEDMNRKRV